MKNNELIEQLKKLPPEYDVVIDHAFSVAIDSEGYSDVMEAGVSDVDRGRGEIAVVTLHGESGGRQLQAPAASNEEVPF